MEANWAINQWYVAGWDYEIDRKPLARTICGQPIMLYRRFDRTVVAMRDACPHRMLPLSMGIKEGRQYPLPLPRPSARQSRPGRGNAAEK